MAEQFVGSGWSFPLRIGPTGGIALVSGEKEVEEAIRLVLSTAPGERPMRPEFGCAIHDVQAGEVFAVLQRVPGVELVDEVVLHPADPLTGKRGEATGRIDLDRPSLVFSYDHRVRVIGE